MGLKTRAYKVEGYDLTLPSAYAKITNVVIDKEGNATATFFIQQSREATMNSTPLVIQNLDCKIDKNLPIYEQIYATSKIFMFKGWEDDIVVELPEEVIPEYLPPEKEKETEHTEAAAGGTNISEVE